MMDQRERVRRYLLFLIGLAVNALGVAFISRAALGTSPLSSLSFVLSLSTPLTLGEYTVLFNTLFLIGEALVRRTFTLRQAVQLPFTLLFSGCIDLFMWIISTQLHGTLPMQLLYLAAGCLLLSLGIAFEVFGGVVMLPGEALVRAISQRWNIPFHRVKVVFDSTITVLAALLALKVFGRLNGVKEGTVVAALVVGQLVKMYSRLLGPAMERFCTGGTPYTHTV